ncbi:MAG: hypothetical protein DI536_25725 [Archangium gephyra]|uniref:Uncharacterized protein n=1 Tax=Archangium gephyra TaxID=48 RepID=A0A2W5SXD7_9BACT|nr:MAG: hypothetical protein DI536_25725 [Archangium gephyra]
MNPVTNRPRTQPPRVAPQQRTQQPQSLLQQGVSFFERNRTQLQGAGAAAMRARGLLTEANTLRRQRSGQQVSRFNTTRPQNTTFGRTMRGVRLGAPIASAGMSATRLPGQLATAARDIRQAFRTGDTRAAERSSRDALSTASTLGQTIGAPRNVTLGSQSQTVRRSLDMARRFISRSAGPVSTTVRNVASRLASSSTARVATQLASNTALRTTGRIAARTAGRFVPGANVAIAALDINEARRALQDPNAGVGRRTTAVITALGSAAAASNIPVVSQVGAAISTISSAIGAWFS